jgi:cold shock CspA family protein
MYTPTDPEGGASDRGSYSPTRSYSPTAAAAAAAASPSRAAPASEAAASPVDRHAQPEQRRDATPAETQPLRGRRLSGRVSEFNAAKRFGFLVCTDPAFQSTKEVFFHANDLLSALTRVDAGSRLSFELVPSETRSSDPGWKATRLAAEGEDVAPLPRVAQHQHHRQRHQQRAHGGWVSHHPPPPTKRRGRVAVFHEHDGFGHVVIETDGPLLSPSSQATHLLFRREQLWVGPGVDPGRAWVQGNDSVEVTLDPRSGQIQWVAASNGGPLPLRPLPPPPQPPVHMHAPPHAHYHHHQPYLPPPPPVAAPVLYAPQQPYHALPMQQPSLEVQPLAYQHLVHQQQQQQHRHGHPYQPQQFVQQQLPHNYAYGMQQQQQQQPQPSQFLQPTVAPPHVPGGALEALQRLASMCQASSAPQPQPTPPPPPPAPTALIPGTRMSHEALKQFLDRYRHNGTTAAAAAPQV